MANQENSWAPDLTDRFQEVPMTKLPAKHSHKFSIADKDAVHTLLLKVGAPTGSHCVDGNKLVRAVSQAARQYDHTRQPLAEAFLHGLLTGYAVALKHR
jgi:hypothetical protein